MVLDLLKKLFRRGRNFSNSESIKKVSYPLELLPKANFKKINTDELHPAKSFLLRKSLNPSKIYSDIIRADEIFQEAKDLYELSSNLFSIFCLEHLQYIPDKTRSVYYDNWQEGEEPLKASDIVYEIDEKPTPIFFPLNDLHKIVFPYNKTKTVKTKVVKEGKSVNETKNVMESFKGEMQVVHHPTKCNFWHFQLEVKEEESGKPIMRKRVNTGDWKDDAARSFLKISLKEIALRNIGEYELVPEKVYCKVS